MALHSKMMSILFQNRHMHLVWACLSNLCILYEIKLCHVVFVLYDGLLYEWMITMITIYSVRSRNLSAKGDFLENLGVFHGRM